MRKPGQIVLVSFPRTDLAHGKRRPALLIKKAPGAYNDWITCMISSQLRHYVPGLDEIVNETDSDFPETGLKTTSVIRVGRLSTVKSESMMGAIGEIDAERLERIKSRLAKWIAD